MAIEIKITCPLGHTCEKIVGDKLERCAWYVEMQGLHPQTGEKVDEWLCAISWQPILTTEVARTNRGQTKAIESFRNETLKVANAKRREISPPTIKSVDIERDY